MELPLAVDTEVLEAALEVLDALDCLEALDLEILGAAAELEEAVALPDMVLAEDTGREEPPLPPPAVDAGGCVSS